jgi:hypothetical protein
MMDTEEPEPPKSWWRKQLVSLTSWTGESGWDLRPPLASVKAWAC